MSIRKLFVGLVAVAMLVGVTVSAQTMTEAQIRAEIERLMGLVAALSGGTTGGTSAPCTFTRDLTVGSTGADVSCLQGYLVSQGHLMMPAGVAMGYFGDLTRAATARWQTANGVAPAVGYFGPLSQAKYRMVAGGTGTGSTGSVTCPVGFTCTQTGGTPSTPSGDLEGDAGSVEEYRLVSGLTNEKVGEDEEDKPVAGIEITTDEGSDLEFTAVKLVFNEGTAGSDFEDYASEVSLWLDDEEVGRVDADGFTDDNQWTKTISLDDGAIIRAGEMGKLVVAVSGISNIDTGDATDTWTVDFRQLRFRDGAGDSTSEDPTLDPRTFSFETFATASDVELKIAENEDAINDAHVVDVHATADTDDVSMLSFTMEAKGDSDLEVKKLSASTTVTGASNVDDLVKEITLWVGTSESALEELASGTSIEDTDGASVGSVEDYLFDDLDYTIEAGDKVYAEIRVSFNSVADALDEGDTLKVEITEAETDTASMWDVRDESNTRLVDSDITGSATGEASAVYDNALKVTFVSESATSNQASTNISGGDDTGTFKITFDVEAFGQDIYIDGDVIATSTPGTITSGADGIVWATSTDSTATSSTAVSTSLGATTLTSSETNSGDVTTPGAKSFLVEDGSDSRRFTLEVKVGPVTGDMSLMGIVLKAINWDTDSGDAHANLYNFDLGEFKTGLVQLDQT